MKKIKISDKQFRISITAENIQEIVDRLAVRLNEDYAGKEVLFVGILNGAFMFAADLLRKITFPCKITFLKLSSYQGTLSTGTIQNLIGMNEDIKDKIVVIIEDIADSGLTLENITTKLKEYKPAELKIVTLLCKSDVFMEKIRIDYIGMEVPNDFVIGYGLDYNGYGRNYKDIYTINN